MYSATLCHCSWYALPDNPDTCPVCSRRRFLCRKVHCFIFRSCVTYVTSVLHHTETPAPPFPLHGFYLCVACAAHAHSPCFPIRVTASVGFSSVSFDIT